MTRWLPKEGKDVRNWILFFSGLIGVAYETIAEGVDRPALLVVFASMMGLPIFLSKDEAVKQGRNADVNAKPPPPPVDGGGDQPNVLE